METVGLLLVCSPVLTPSEISASAWLEERVPNAVLGSLE